MFPRAFTSTLLLTALSAAGLYASCDSVQENGAPSVRATTKPFSVHTLSVHTDTLEVTRRARLAGWVGTLGDGASGIRFWVFSGGEVVFKSDVQESVCVDIPLEPGSYTLVYDNSYSLFSPKTVWSSVHLEQQSTAQPRKAGQSTI